MSQNQKSTFNWKAMVIATVIYFIGNLLFWNLLMGALGWTWTNHWYIQMPINWAVLMIMYMVIADRMAKTNGDGNV
jgi:hypothetical protein